MQKMTLVLLFGLLASTIAQNKGNPLVPDSSKYKRLAVASEPQCSRKKILWCAEEIAGERKQLPFLIHLYFDNS